MFKKSATSAVSLLMLQNVLHFLVLHHAGQNSWYR